MDANTDDHLRPGGAGEAHKHVPVAGPDYVDSNDASDTGAGPDTAVPRPSNAR